MTMWLETKANDDHRCAQTVFANGCGRLIQSKEIYYRTQFRIGIEQQKRCAECHAKDHNSEKMTIKRKQVS